MSTSEALNAFRQRCEANKTRQQVNNASLPAGSPMYYYCKFCGDPTETLPEGHWGTPKTVCDPCQSLRTLGLLSPKGEPTT